MKRITIYFLFLCFAVTLYASEPLFEALQNWPQWRGPDATGAAHNAKPPLEWSETKNIKWKVELPGKGHSTPIIWSNKIFVTSAISAEQVAEGPQTKQKFTVFCLNKSTGKISWQKTVREQVPHEGTHQTASWASGSAVTDGELIYAHFGSNGLFCLDYKGKVKWQKDLGKMQTRNSFGEGISPALYGNTLVICWDHEGGSFIVALDKKTGKEIWRKERDEPTSWATPAIVKYQDKTQVIVNATNRVRSYNLETGDVIWETSGMTANTIPSPVYADGMVYCASGFRGSALLAIDMSAAKGDITDSEAILWKYDRDTPYVPSLLLYKDLLYFMKNTRGLLSCLNAKTGAVHYGPERLDGITNIYASPVAANDHVYLSGREGTTLVIKHGPLFELVASNKLEDGIDASLAIVGNELFIRGNKYLYCIAE